MTQSFDKSPYSTEKTPKSMWQHLNATKNFYYKTIADRLRTVSCGNDSYPTGVVKPVNGIPTLPLTWSLKTTITTGECLISFSRGLPKCKEWQTSQKKKKKIYVSPLIEPAILGIPIGCLRPLGNRDKCFATFKSLAIQWSDRVCGGISKLWKNQHVAIQNIKVVIVIQWNLPKPILIRTKEKYRFRQVIGLDRLTFTALGKISYKKLKYLHSTKQKWYK